MYSYYNNSQFFPEVFCVTGVQKDQKHLLSESGVHDLEDMSVCACKPENVHMHAYK